MSVLQDALFVLAVIGAGQLLMGHHRTDEPRRSPRRR